ncbi:transporter substrate-binding domain-containing protein [Streptococcus ruminantium]|uniref:transporter substrate-binding domain-containing protein n=1 Tax=Streptococcus ruminantium TaxID=1917441 RepID=UPI0012DF06A8|nr:transporter substrate-binding domain-containing protein [Streptococcus ruminantium]
MKKLLTLAALLAILTLVACSSTSPQSRLDAIKEKGTLVVATSPDYAPFEFQTLVDGKNKVVGSDIALAQKIADELGVKLEVSSMSFDNVLSSIQSGKADIAIAGLSYSEQRAKVFDFSEIYYQVADTLLVKKSNLDRYTALADLKGQKVAVQKGSTQEVYAKENMTDVSLISLGAMGEAINELKTGQVEAVLVDKPVALGYAAQNDDLALATIPFPIVKENGKAIAMPKGSADLKAAIDAVIKKVVENNEYETFLKEAAKYTVSE